MKITIKEVKEHGNLKDERIILKILNDTDIGSYMLADTTYISEDEVSNKLRHTFWMPDKLVKKNDLIVIYTKDGEASSKKNKSGSTTYFFYWGIDKTIWNKHKDSATIFFINDWLSKQV